MIQIQCPECSEWCLDSKFIEHEKKHINFFDKLEGVYT